MAEDWKDELKKVVESKPANVPKQDRDFVESSRRELAAFVSETVLPAFHALKDELEQYDREVSIDERTYQAAIHVFKDGKEEYSYGIRGNIYHRMTFAFPEIDQDNEPRIAKAEIIPSQGSKREYDLKKFTHDGIIKDFLKEYANWAE